MKRYIFIFIIIGNLTRGYCQSEEVKGENIAFKDMPSEKVYVHHNTSFLLSGEYLYYSVFCLNSKTNKLSGLSKIAYVELIGKDTISVFKHKIRLVSGLGQGEFFVPAEIKSGNYKLIAYTQWMRNGSGNNFFQENISIVNQFSNNQKNILSLKKDVINKEINEVVKKDSKEIKNIDDNELVKIQMHQRSFKNREKVVFKVLSSKNNKSYGDYSISIRKIDSFSGSRRLTSGDFSYKKEPINNPKKFSGVNFLPELRGEILSGKVLFLDTKKSAYNVKVGLSIPGKGFTFKMARTNSQGKFYFNLLKDYKYSESFIQVITEEGRNYLLEMDESIEIEKKHLKFEDFKILKQNTEEILERSIQIQIENSYSSVKPNIFSVFKVKEPFYGLSSIDYYLDDYTRFSTLKETIVEILEFVNVKNKKGEKTIHVVKGDGTKASDINPLVLVDGVVIENHGAIMDFNTKKVKKISVIREKYNYGSQIFEGVVSIETFKGDYKNVKEGPYLKNLKLNNPLKDKIYFKQIYDNNEELNHIPDLRFQLLWQPKFKLKEKEQKIVFFTSDNDGEYEINLEGFTISGKAVSIKERFTVN